MYYLQTRFYDPQTGRFISPDTPDYLDPESINGLNIYAYGLNNPVMYVDPTGHFVLSIFLTCLIAGVLIGAIVGGIAAAQNGSDILTGVLTGALLGGAVGAVASLGSAYLAGGISGLLSKYVTDSISVIYGGSYGSLGDYAVAFIFGGISSKLSAAIKTVKHGKCALELLKMASDVVIRPAVNQLVGMGLQNKGWNRDKYIYDVITRLHTYNETRFISKFELLGLNIKIDWLKCLERGTMRGLYRWFAGIF